jgi:lysophospholipase L1-like esterase
MAVTSLPRPRSKGSRRFLFRAVLSMTALVLAVGGAWVALRAYFWYCEHEHRRPPAIIRTSAILHRVFGRPECDAVFRVVAGEQEQRFRTQWDHDMVVGLSRDLFAPTLMFGRLSYRYRPHVRVRDFYVWTGLQPRSLSARATPALDAALESCRPRHEALFETDKHGFKPTGIARREGEPSVLFVGDSFTEGMYVAPEDTFVGLFARRLKREGIALAAVNGGVKGYSALEEAWTAQKFARTVSARAVIVLLFPNDVTSDYRAVTHNAAPVEIREHLYAQMFRPLLRLRDYCRQDEVRLFLVALPAWSQVAKPLEPHFQRRIARWCRRNGVSFLDPLEYLRVNGGGDNYFRWDPHFSEHGHARMAEFLFEATERDLRTLARPR